MMGVAAGAQVQMKVHADLVAQPLHEIVHQLGLKGADPLLLNRNVVGEKDPPADIHHGLAQRFVERHYGTAEAADSRAIAERLAERASQHDPDVLDRVMLVDMQVAARVEFEIEEAMTREALEHVIEEGHPGRDLGSALAVERKFDCDLGLTRAALDPGAAGRSVLAARGHRAIRPDTDSTSAARFAIIASLVHLRLRCRPPSRTSIARAWPSNPSIRASRATAGPSLPSAAAEPSIILVRLRKSYAPSGEA